MPGTHMHYAMAQLLPPFTRALSLYPGWPFLGQELGGEDHKWLQFGWLREDWDRAEGSVVLCTPCFLSDGALKPHICIKKSNFHLHFRLEDWTYSVMWLQIIILKWDREDVVSTVIIFQNPPATWIKRTTWVFFLFQTQILETYWDSFSQYL